MTIINIKYELNKFYSHIISDLNNSDICWEMDVVHDKDGYPRFSINGYSTCRACRVSYILHKGDIPNGMQIRHICHNTKCVNPNHLIYGTSLDNNKDKVDANRQAKGSINGNSKLTEKFVIEIIIDVFNGKYQNYHQIANIYGVQYQTIANIFWGYNWTHITDQLQVPLSDIRSKISGRPLIKGKQKLIDDDVRNIKIRIANGESNASIARYFNIDPARISNIKNGLAWKHVI